MSMVNDLDALQELRSDFPSEAGSAALRQQRPNGRHDPRCKGDLDHVRHDEMNERTSGDCNGNALSIFRKWLTLSISIPVYLLT